MTVVSLISILARAIVASSRSASFWSLDLLGNTESADADLGSVVDSEDFPSVDGVFQASINFFRSSYKVDKNSSEWLSSEKTNNIG